MAQRAESGRVRLRPDADGGEHGGPACRHGPRPRVGEDGEIRTNRRLTMTVTQSDLKLDGNAIGGLLREIFTMEMTTAESTCSGCHKEHAVGQVDVYLNAPGAVVRCPACGQVLMRIVRGGRRYWLDLTGIR